MKAAVVKQPHSPIVIEDRPIPEPKAGEVLIRVLACGVCHSDMLVVEGAWPGIQYPRIPGHEVVGVIEGTGANVTDWKKGQRVGVGWHGGQDNTCPECRRGDFANCRNVKVAGISYDGGYQQYMVAPIEALAAVPDSLSDAEAAPLLCAGITTFNALRHSGAMPPDLVAVQGVGGLGHLGIQFANKCGYRGGRHRTWARERDARQKARGKRLHRQPSDERGAGTTETGRRKAGPGDSPQLESDVRTHRRSGTARQTDGDRRDSRSH